MKTNDYKIISECVDRGINYGLNRAYKHEDNPAREIIINSVFQEIMNEICEYFIFEDNQK